MADRRRPISYFGAYLAAEPELGHSMQAEGTGPFPPGQEILTAVQVIQSLVGTGCKLGLSSWVIVSIHSVLARHQPSAIYPNDFWPSILVTGVSMSMAMRIFVRHAAADYPVTQEKRGAERR